MIHVGFTGTRFGMTFEQHRSAFDIVSALATTALGNRNPWVGHHGDCVGADAEFHLIAYNNGGRVIIHPGPIGVHTAHCRGDERRDPMTHFARNRVIVDEATVMLATPREAVRQSRGGTWYTIGRAEKSGKPLALVLPSGEVAYSGAAWPMAVQP